MAFNWDKLTKLRQNNPRPKYALPECTRQLKKRSNDPYLLAWKAELSLKSGSYGLQVYHEQLVPLCRRVPPISDAELLDYIFNLSIESRRRDDPLSLTLNSGDNYPVEAWEKAAKVLKTPKERLDLWSKFFVCAMKADCWEHVRLALQQAQKEVPNKKKNITFSLILAFQLSGEKYIQMAEWATKSVTKDISPEVIQKFVNDGTLQQSLAYRYLKKAFENSSKSLENVDRIQHMRDLRFMVQIFQRQKRALELIQLWNTSAPAIQDILNANHSEVLQLKLDILKEEGQWRDLWDLVSPKLTVAIQNANGNSNSDQLSTLKIWKLWSTLLDAAYHLWDTNEEVQGTTQQLLTRMLEAPHVSREVLLARLFFASQKELRHLLSACKDYWKRYSQLNCCFDDLRRFVEQLDQNEQSDFHNFITKSAEELKLELEDATESSLKMWLQAEINVAKFDYLLTISRPTRPKSDVVKAFVRNAIRLYYVGTQIRNECYRDAGTLAIMGLLVLHHIFIDKRRLPVDRTLTDDLTRNSRIMLQAGFLARHLTAGEGGKQNRSLILLSTRIHLGLGLGTLAFDLYRHARVKEILNDTISYILLTQISRTHPFDATSSKKAFPDKELRNVIGVIERMESKVDDFLYTDMQNFQHDQAIELVELKRKLRGSFTKHLCMLERRKIARWKGEPVDQLEIELRGKYRSGSCVIYPRRRDLLVFSCVPILSILTSCYESIRYQLIELGCESITDNRDFDVLPNFESSDNYLIDRLTMLDVYPNEAWYYEQLARQEYTCRLVFGEPRSEPLEDRIISIANSGLGAESQMEGLDNIHNEARKSHEREDDLRSDWLCARSIAVDVYDGARSHDTGKSLEERFELACWALTEVCVEMENLILPESTGFKLEDEYLLPNEIGLLTYYSLLELLRVYWKICETMKDYQKKRHELGRRVKKQLVDQFATRVEDTYKLLRKVVGSMIVALKRRGEQSILAQVGWGPTGEALTKVLSDDDMRLYAREYVESAIEALEGVLKVKLK
ncbi:hypothetical protein K469DRAFT_722076 [Zopfia rhizophila CBS 207.26]|uniref:N-acetyltransferase B complex non catalytic subunit-domain-containing protein n=1 Tax=Zopfia rhizophila CBS 207.26 TaxID=1314779 RepID=A0A6A6DC23_9PEZI|nr:hypothetical protein K469DRAFT_722076 [Zopfia rhizophila CBS 207.26]